MSVEGYVIEFDVAVVNKTGAVSIQAMQIAKRLHPVVGVQLSHLHSCFAIFNVLLGS
jgi:hypothetical protein